MLFSDTQWRIGLFFFLAPSASAKHRYARKAIDSTPTASRTYAPRANAPATAHPAGPAATGTGYLMTETELDGVIAGCTSTSLLRITGAGGVTTSTICAGAPAPLTTLMDVWSSWQGVVSQAAPVTAPDDGCSIVHPQDGGIQYCTCGSGGKASSVSTMLGFSSMNLTTVCATPGALPTGYVQVPPIANVDEQPSGVDLIWTDPPTAQCGYGTDPSAACWKILNMDAYVKWWDKAFEGQCGSHSAFSDCFWENMAPNNPSNCTGIGSDCKDVDWSGFQNEWNGVRNFYVAWTIRSMNKFFSVYYNAIVAAEATSSLMIGNITKIIDPVEHTGVGTDVMMELLTVGLAMIPGPEGLIAQNIMKAADQLPGILSFLYPANTIDNQVEEMQDLSAEFGAVVNTFENNIGAVLPAVLNNASNFAILAQDGAFSTNDAVDENTLKNNLLQALYTVLISRSYQMNQIILTRTLHTDVHALSTNGTKLNWPLCSDSYDGNNLCDTWWYDSATGITYGLADPGNYNHNFNNEMATWFHNFTTPELLFRGADACAQAAKGTSGGDPVLNAGPTTTTPDFSCLSNMTVCTWSLTPMGGSHGGAFDYDNFFTDCKYTGVFPHDGMGDGCDPKGGDPASYIQAFRSYLGWAVLADSTATTDYQFCASDGSHDF